MYEKVVIITPGQVDEFYRRPGDEDLLSELPAQDQDAAAEPLPRWRRLVPTSLEPHADRLHRFQKRQSEVIDGSVHEVLGIQWWMWAAIALLLVLFVVALLWGKITAAGFPGLDIVGTKSEVGISGSERVEGKVANTGYKNYEDIVVRATIYDLNGQQIEKIDEYIGDIPSGSKQAFSITPKVNLGPAYRVEFDLASEGPSVSIPWWVWVALGSFAFFVILVLAHRTIMGYRFPGLEIVAANLITDEGGHTKVLGRLVNYSRKHYERIVVEGNILDVYDQKIESFRQYVGTIDSKAQKEFYVVPRRDLAKAHKVKLRITTNKQAS